MKEPVVVTIIGVPVACKDGIKDSWREVAEWAAGKLKALFGDQVRVRYFDFFDPDCPTIPPDCKLPLVLTDGLVVSSGGKISIPLIRKKIEDLLVIH